MSHLQAAPWRARGGAGRRALWALTLALICGLGGGCPARPAAEAAPAPAAPVPVRVAQVRVMTLRPRLELTATLRAAPDASAAIDAQVAGVIEALRVAEGDRVAAGDLLLSLDPRAARLQRARASAAAQLERAQLERLQAGPRAAELEVARQALAGARATAERKRRALALAQPLVERGEVSGAAQAGLASGVAESAAAEASAAAQLQLLEAGARSEDLAVGRARLEMAEADLASAELALARCEVRSPIGGVVTRVSVRVGLQAAPGTPLVEVVDPARLLAEVRVPRAALEELRVGSRAEVVWLDGQPSQPSQVLRLGAASATGDVLAYVPVGASERTLRPRMGCRVVVWLREVPDALAIPVEAIAERGGASVVTAIRAGLASPVEVELGARASGFVQVTRGLERGDQVALTGGYDLPEGTPVVAAGGASVAAEGSQ